MDWRYGVYASDLRVLSVEAATAPALGNLNRFGRLVRCGVAAVGGGDSATAAPGILFRRGAVGLSSLHHRLDVSPRPIGHPSACLVVV